MKDGIGAGYGRAGQFLEVGLRFGLTVVVGALGGLKLDQRWGTKPWIMIVLTFVSMGAAFYWLMLKLKNMQQEDEAAEQKSDER